ncbi:threonine/serine exporter family protein [Gordonia alkaliphila]|uniref:threonine/serine ThrE exporter family protein n=1 Tax=Gordonia alkaliphila TaxID=1053547 RepID=UPI001FF18733|nr:threonine/serine exporter family protein [Gordonia alkaliphila]MCK0438707.1 threonine/serine exporter family protein [Gordonia alkaliphila]
MADDSLGPTTVEPDELLTLVAHVSEALNRSSYPVPLTNAVIHDICRAYHGAIETEVFATYIIAIDKKTGQVTAANTGAMYRFDQIADTEALVDRLRVGDVPIPEALAGLAAIADSTAPVNFWLRLLGYLMMALGFAFCFQMSFAASLAAVTVSLPIAAISMWSSIKGTLAALMPVLLTFLAALAITLWAVHGGLEDSARLAVIPVVTLIPGAALATSLIELTSGDMIAGATRLISALVVLASMAFGLALAIDIVGISSSQLQDLPTDKAPAWVLLLAAPTFGIGSFLYFSTPKRLWGWAIAFIIATFWLNRLLELWMLPAFAGGLALGVALLTAWAINAHTRSRPSSLVMFMPTFWLMVPGSMGFVAVSGAITSDRALGDLGTNAALSLLSMAICMMIAAVLAPLVTRRPHALDRSVLLTAARTHLRHRDRD